MQSVIYAIFTTTTCVDPMNWDQHWRGKAPETVTGFSAKAEPWDRASTEDIIGYATDEAEAEKYCNDFNREREAEGSHDCCVLHACYMEISALVKT